MSNKAFKMVLSGTLATALTFSTLSNFIPVINESTSSVSATSTSLKTNSTMTSNGLKVLGTNAIEQYIAKQVFSGKTKISLAKFKDTKNIPTNTNYTNPAKLNQPLLGYVNKVTASKKYKNGVPKTLTVTYLKTNKQAVKEFKAISNYISEVSSEIGKNKDVYNKYAVIHKYSIPTAYTSTTEKLYKKANSGVKLTKAEKAKYLKESTIYNYVAAHEEKPTNRNGLANTFTYLSNQLGLYSKIITFKKDGVTVPVNTMKVNGVITLAASIDDLHSIAGGFYTFGSSLSDVTKKGYKKFGKSSKYTKLLSSGNTYDYYVVTKKYAKNVDVAATIVNNSLTDYEKEYNGEQSIGWLVDIKTAKRLTKSDLKTLKTKITALSKSKDYSISNVEIVEDLNNKPTYHYEILFSIERDNTK